MLAPPTTRRLAVVAGLVLLAAPARAQFSQFSWTFSSDTSGFGTVTPDQMIIVGPDGSFSSSCQSSGGSTASFQATAPYDLVLVADFDVENHDKGGNDYDLLVTIVDGRQQQVTGSCSGCQLVLEVPAGSTFGFGVYSFAKLDCFLQHFSHRFIITFLLCKEA